MKRTQSNISALADYAPLYSNPVVETFYASKRLLVCGEVYKTNEDVLPHFTKCTLTFCFGDFKNPTRRGLIRSDNIR